PTVRERSRFSASRVSGSGCRKRNPLGDRRKCRPLSDRCPDRQGDYEPLPAVDKSQKFPRVCPVPLAASRPGELLGLLSGSAFSVALSYVSPLSDKQILSDIG